MTRMSAQFREQLLAAAAQEAFPRLKNTGPGHRREFAAHCAVIMTT